MVTRIDPSEEIKDDFRYKDDRNCCCVVALMKVMDCTYDTAYKWCQEKGGRSRRRGMYMPQIVKMFEEMQNTPNKKGPYGKENKITINQFIKKHPVGRFFCVHKGHAFAIVDGVLYDHVDKPRRQIYYAHRVYPKHLQQRA